MNYRAEIDGLRAVAVVPVVLFHAGFEFFSGGYVGVDVFFVISGYLITTIIYDELRDGRFSLVKFYERRARRILPALFAVIITCVPFAWFWMPQQQLKDFLQSVAAVSLFSSNFLFWLESGYFAEAAEMKPLLHTWSLAVEEQYYLFFPLIYMLVFRVAKRLLTPLLCILFISSLAIAELGWRGDASANFYLLHTRLWELMAGSLCAIILSKTRSMPNSTLLSFAGLLCIAVSVIFYNETTPFPSLYALLPVAGTSLIILFGSSGTLTARVLSFRPFVGIGLISYSVYLWHQPLFAFARIRILPYASETDFAVLALASLGLGYLSWLWIEKPFRNKRKVSVQKVWSFSAVGLISLVLFGGLGQQNDRFADVRKLFISPAPLSLANYSPKREQCHITSLSQLAAGFCAYHRPNTSIAVFGNSHATELAYAVASEAEQMGLGIVQMTATGCGTYFRDKKSFCAQFTQKAIDRILNDQSISHVIISYRTDSFSENDWREYRSILNKISSKELIVVPQVPFIFRDINYYSFINNNSDLIRTVNTNEYLRSNHILKTKKIAKEISLGIVDVASVFCDNQHCFGVIDGKSLYFDDDHMSVHGARLLSNKIFESQWSEGLMRRKSES